MGSIRGLAGLVRGPGLTLRQADGCAGRDRTIVGCVGRSRSLRGPLGRQWWPERVTSEETSLRSCDFDDAFPGRWLC